MSLEETSFASVLCVQANMMIIAKGYRIAIICSHSHSSISVKWFEQVVGYDICFSTACNRAWLMFDPYQVFFVFVLVFGQWIISLYRIIVWVAYYPLPLGGNID